MAQVDDCRLVDMHQIHGVKIERNTLAFTMYISTIEFSGS